MKLRRIEIDKYGPLEKISWELPQLAVVYDDNMTGKTSVVDLIVRFLFVSRKNSTTFENFIRFDQEEPHVKIEVDNGGQIYSFGSDSSETPLSELLGWDNDELFRLLCIRAGDNQLVSSPRKRPSMLQALASLVAGVSTEKLNRVDRDIRNSCQITKSNNWTNSKSSDPPRLKDEIYNEIVPFLRQIDEVKMNLREMGKIESKLEMLKGSVKEKRNTLNEISDELDRLKAVKIDNLVNQIENLTDQLGKYTRIRVDYLHQWDEAKGEFEKARQRLDGDSEMGEEGLEERAKSLKKQIEQNQKKLEVALPQRKQQVETSLKEKKREKREIKREWEKRKRSIRDFVRSEIKQRLADIREKQSYEKSIWVAYRPFFYIVSGGLICFGLPLGVIVTPWLFAVAFAGVLSLGVTVRNEVVRRKTLRDIDKLQTEAVRGFNDRFSHFWDKEIKDSKELETRLDDLYVQARDSFFEEKGFKDLDQEIGQLENEKKQLKKEKKQLTTDIKQLKERKSDVNNKIDNTRRKLSSARQTLESLREKTGQPELQSFQTLLDQKKEIKQRLEQLKARLENELDRSDEDLAQLVEKARREVSNTERKTGGEFKICNQGSLNEKKEKLLRNKQELKREIEDLDQKIDSTRNELRAKKEDLRTRYNLDSERPQQLFEMEKKYKSVLDTVIIDRLAGFKARSLLQELSKVYERDLDGFISGRKSSVGSVSSLFSQVMGDRFEVTFDYDREEFLIRENGDEYFEGDLSSGGRKHLFYATRLAFVRDVVPQPAFLVLDDPFLFYHRQRKKKAIGQLEYLLEEGWQVVCFTVDRTTRDFFVSQLNAPEFGLGDL